MLLYKKANQQGASYLELRGKRCNSRSDVFIGDFVWTGGSAPRGSRARLHRIAGGPGHHRGLRLGGRASEDYRPTPLLHVVEQRVGLHRALRFPHHGSSMLRAQRNSPLWILHKLAAAS